MAGIEHAVALRGKGNMSTMPEPKGIAGCASDSYGDATRSPRLHVGLKAALLVALFSTTIVCSNLPTRATAASPPQLTTKVIAMLTSETFTLTGHNFGAATTASSLRFTDSLGDVKNLASTDSKTIQSWTDTQISATLPFGVSGQLQVVTSSGTSGPAELLVYAEDLVPMVNAGSSHPLALAVAPRGAAWVNEEFHTRLSSVSSGLDQAAFDIPEYPFGIFANPFANHAPTTFSENGEDVRVAPDGAVWFTEGGEDLYFPADVGATQTNRRRVIRFDPSTVTFSCYNDRINNSVATGLWLDSASGRVWYTEAGLQNGSAIVSFTPSDVVSDCVWDPQTPAPNPVCAGDQTAHCYRRYPLPRPGVYPAHLAATPSSQGQYIWFTEAWGNAIGRLDPATGDVLELPLPPWPVTFLTNQPWSLAFDHEGDLWVTYFRSAKVARVRTSAVTAACLQPVPSGRANPCIDEIVQGSTGADGNTIHTLAVDSSDRIWFALSTSQAGGTRIGFISVAQGDAVTWLPPIAGGGSISGIATDPANGDVWFASYDDQTLGRLQPCRIGFAALVDFAESYNSTPGSANWNGHMDFNGNGTVDYFDLLTFAKAFSPGC